jgi:hypothetical protein
MIPCYAVVSYLNSRGGAGYRAWGYTCEQARYYARGRLIGDAFSTGARGRIFDADGAVLPSDHTLWQRLRPLQVQWAILPTGTVPQTSALTARGLFTLAATRGGEDVFRVSPSASG